MCEALVCLLCSLCPQDSRTAKLREEVAQQELQVSELLRLVGQPIRARQEEVAELLAGIVQESSSESASTSLDEVSKKNASLRAAHAARAASVMARDAPNGSLGADSFGGNDDIEAVQNRILSRIGMLPKRRW